MAISINDYRINHYLLDLPALTAHWSWLLPSQFHVRMITRFGDLFIVLPDKSVHMLDIGCGTLKKVAPDSDDLRKQIREGEKNNEWFLIPLVDQLVKSGKCLEPNQCYGFRVPPVLGGQYTIENCAVFPIADYYGGHGSILRQLVDVPDGSKVVIEIINSPTK